MVQQRDRIEGLQLVHTGLVCRNIDAAKARLSEMLNVSWVEVEREDWSDSRSMFPLTLRMRALGWQISN